MDGGGKEFLRIRRKGEENKRKKRKTGVCFIRERHQGYRPHVWIREEEGQVLYRIWYNFFAEQSLLLCACTVKGKHLG